MFTLLLNLHLTIRFHDHGKTKQILQKERKRIIPEIILHETC